MKQLLVRLLLFLAFLKGTIIAILITSFNPIQEKFGLSLTQLGLITTIFYLFVFIGTFFWANAMGRFSRLKIFEIGSLMWTIGLIITFSNLPFYLYIALFSIIGFGTESNTIIIMNHINDLSNSETITKNNSMNIVFNGLGILIGTALTSILEQNYGINWNFITGCVGIISFCVFFGIRILMVYSWENQDMQNLKEEITKMAKIDEPHFSKQSIKESLSNPLNLVVLLIILIYLPFNTFYNVWLQKYYTDSRDLTQMMGSISFIFTSGAEFLGIVFTGIILDKYFQNKALKAKVAAILGIIAFPLFFLGFLIPWNMAIPSDNLNFIQNCFFMFQYAITNKNTFIAYTALFFGFFFISMQAPIFFVLVAENNDKKTRSIVLNIAAMINSISWAIGPILGGILGDHYNLQNILLIPPIIYLITSGPLLYISYIIKKKEESSKSKNLINLK